jgi:hypothetical protein
MSCHTQLNLYLQNGHSQIVSLPNLRIVDFGYGHTGSAHDSTAWDETHLAREHATILEGDEFVWADSAYPVELFC